MIFPSDPEYCVPTELIRYRSVLPESPSEGATFAIRPDGLVEFVPPIAYTIDGDSRAVVDLLALSTVIVDAFVVIAASWSALLSARRRRRSRKLDWYVAVSSSISLPTGWTPLSGISRNFRPLFNGGNLSGSPIAGDSLMALDWPLNQLGAQGANVRGIRYFLMHAVTGSLDGNFHRQTDEAVRKRLAAPRGPHVIRLCIGPRRTGVRPALRAPRSRSVRRRHATRLCCINPRLQRSGVTIEFAVAVAISRSTWSRTMVSTCRTLRPS